MRENRLRTLWKSGGAAINGWLAIPNSFSAETMAHQGWDSLTIDLQHGVVDYQSMIPMLQAISTTDTVPVVRVPWLEPSALMKSLDAGAYGVICPMINTPDEAARLVAYTHYAPRGTRSFGPVRALLYGGPSDLSLALGCRPVFDDVDPPVEQAIDHILDRAKAHGLVAGIHNGTPE